MRDRVLRCKTFFLFLCLAVIPVTSECFPEKALIREVRYVIDGDTVILEGGARLRYIGIDTPETRRREDGEWIYDPEPFAEEAKALNWDLTHGKRLRIEFDEVRRDRYGRLLGYVFCADGEMVNESLVAAGLATVYTFPPNVKYRLELIAAQMGAMEAGRGLWSNVPRIRPDEGEAHIGEVVTVRGTIKRVTVGAGSVYLLFDEARTGSLALRIPSGNTVFFDKEGIDPFTGYTGLEVLASGRVEERGRVEMYIDGPFQIHVLDASAP